MFNLDKNIFNYSPDKLTFQYISYAEKIKDMDKGILPGTSGKRPSFVHVEKTLPKQISAIRGKSKEYVSAVLSLLAHFNNSDTLYSGQIVELYKQQFFKDNLDTPTFSEGDIKDLLSDHFLKTWKYQGQKYFYSEEEQKEIKTKTPFFQVTNIGVRFGIPLVDSSGEQKGMIDLVSLGWIPGKMPPYFPRISFELNKNRGEVSDEELGQLIERVTPLYVEALKNKRPFSGKFDCADGNTYFCDYVHPDMIYWQLETLMKSMNKSVEELKHSTFDTEKHRIYLFGDETLCLRTPDDGISEDEREEIFNKLLSVVRGYQISQ